MRDDLISRQAVLGIIQSLYPEMPRVPWLRKDWQERYEPYINAEKAIRTLPSAQPEDWMEQNKDRILKAGMEGREVEFRIGGRLFAIREKAQ